MASQPVSDLTEPNETSDAVTKKNVDDLIADNVGVDNIAGEGSPFFKENGNFQATHAINMVFKKLLNLSTPLEPYEAVKKKKEYVDERPHIIAVHTHYCGHLRKSEYHFTFGGHIGSKLDTGFLVPQLGHIKKIQTKISHEGKDSSRNIFEGGSIFTVTAIRDTGEVSNLLTYECFLVIVVLAEMMVLIKNVGLIAIQKIYRSRGGGGVDIINIKTEKDYSEADHRGKDIPISYLFTFLLELDPL